ncbi:MAG: transposase [Proteobacteria bacterium]|nr:transposase [Pseudomonadota bacterium]
MPSKPSKTSKTSKHSYNEKFKRDAVRLSKKHGVKVAAKKLGVSVSGLYRWRRTYLKAKTPKDEENRSYDDLLKEITFLKKRIRLVSNVNEVIRDTTAILSQNHPEDMK